MVRLNRSTGPDPKACSGTHLVMASYRSQSELEKRWAARSSGCLRLRNHSEDSGIRADSTADSGLPPAESQAIILNILIKSFAKGP